MTSGSRANIASPHGQNATDRAMVGPMTPVAWMLIFHFVLISMTTTVLRA